MDPVSFKVVVLGNSGVGKSWLVKEQLMPNPVNGQTGRAVAEPGRDGGGDSEEATIGVEFNLNKLQVGRRAVLLQIWDTSGKDRYRGMLINYMTNASAIIIVYDPAESMEACMETLGRWYAFASRAASAGHSRRVLYAVVALGHRAEVAEQSVAIGRAFASSVCGAFFHHNRLNTKMAGPKLTPAWLGGKLLGQMEEEEEEEADGMAEDRPGRLARCQSLVQHALRAIFTVDCLRLA